MLTIATATPRCDFLEEFDATVEKHDQFHADKRNSSHKIRLLKKAALTDKVLLQAWTAVEQIFANKNTGIATTYEKYWDYLVSVSEKLEEGLKENVNQKVNIANTYYMDSYLPEESYYDEATNLAIVDVIQNMLQCSQALRDAKPRPKLKLRRESQPIRPEL